MKICRITVALCLTVAVFAVAQDRDSDSTKITKQLFAGMLYTGTAPNGHELQNSVIARAGLMNVFKLPLGQLKLRFWHDISQSAAHLWWQSNQKENTPVWLRIGRFPRPTGMFGRPDPLSPNGLLEPHAQSLIPGAETGALFNITTAVRNDKNWGKINGLWGVFTNNRPTRRHQQKNAIKPEWHYGVRYTRNAIALTCISYLVPPDPEIERNQNGLLLTLETSLVSLTAYRGTDASESNRGLFAEINLGNKYKAIADIARKHNDWRQVELGVTRDFQEKIGIFNLKHRLGFSVKVSETARKVAEYRLYPKQVMIYVMTTL